MSRSAFPASSEEAEEVRSVGKQQEGCKDDEYDSKQKFVFIPKS